MLKSTRGFTLVELMIFVSLLSIILVICAAFVTKLMANMKHNEHRILATFYAEEVKEWLNGEREADWNDFHSMAVADIDGETYCLNSPLLTSDAITSLIAGACTSYDGVGTLQPKIYKRELKLLKNNATNPTYVEAIVTVKWVEGQVEQEVSINSIYQLWE